MSENWKLVHNLGSKAVWTDGFRDDFQYRDLGIEKGTGGAFAAHLVRAKPGHEGDDIHEWHVHDCSFQMVLVLEGWARFEYEGHEGECIIRKGDSNDCDASSGRYIQRPGWRRIRINCYI